MTLKPATHKYKMVRTDLGRLPCRSMLWGALWALTILSCAVTSEFNQQRAQGERQSPVVSMTQTDTSCPSRCQCSVRLKTVNCKHRGLQHIPPDIPTVATILYLSFNKLTKIPKGTFSNLHSLTELALNNNYIMTIEEGAFVGLGNLTRLFLTKNKLGPQLLKVFEGLHNLRYIYLGQNSLEAVPDLGQAPNLLKLILDQNKLKTAQFPDGFGYLKNLSTISLSDNPGINCITDNSFENLAKTIRSVDLARCKLTNISHIAFNNFKNLQTLKVNYNPLPIALLQVFISGLWNVSDLSVLDISGIIRDKIPQDLFKGLESVPLQQLDMSHSNKIGVLLNGTFRFLPKLVRLYMMYCDFDYAEPGTFDGMNRLQLLDLSHGHLKEVPTKLPPSLTSLAMQCNSNIQQIVNSVFIDLANLQSLNISHCDIQILNNDAFVGLWGLKVLDLSNNKIPPFGAKVLSPLTNLRSLILAHNGISIVRGVTSKLFASQTNLTTLDMSFNQLQTLPLDIFQPLASIENLFLRGNNLSEVLAADDRGELFKNCKSLSKLHLENNVIDHMPDNIFSGLHNIDDIILSQNVIRSWKACQFNQTGVKRLNLSGNRVTFVNKSSIIGLHEDLTLDLSSNNFVCSCDMIWFRLWLNNSRREPNISFNGLSEYKCASPHGMAGKALMDFKPYDIWDQCFPPPWMIIIISIGCSVFIVSVILFAVGYRFRWPIKLRWYYFKNGKKRVKDPDDLPLMDEDEGNPQYDVTISYYDDGKDADWVENTLLPRLNQHGGGQWRIFTEGNDILPNETPIGKIDEAMHSSRHIIIVCSRRYFDDNRRRYELEMALTSRAHTRRSVSTIIPVLLCDLEAAVKFLPKCINQDIKEELIWNQKAMDECADRQDLFWNTLDYMIKCEPRLL